MAPCCRARALDHRMSTRHRAREDILLRPDHAGLVPRYRPHRAPGCAGGGAAWRRGPATLPTPRPTRHAHRVEQPAPRAPHPFWPTKRPPNDPAPIRPSVTVANSRHWQLIMAMAAVTPLHPRTAPLVRAGTWRRWAGFVVASGYDPHPDREYAAIRSAAALIDISPLYKYRIAGPDAVRLLDRVVTRDVTRCRVDQALYTTWCDGAGKAIDDGMVSRLGDTTFLLTGTTPSLRWLSMNAVGLDVALEDRSAATATLALQGPLSRAVLERVAEDDVASLRYFRLMHTKLAGIPAIVSRTGYTGDLGYELWVDAERAVALWDALMAAGTPDGITPAGIWALDTARIEAGHIMADVDYHSAHLALIESRKSSPFELGLGWTVSPDKGPFNGRRALEAEREARPRWR